MQASLVDLIVLLQGGVLADQIAAFDQHVRRGEADALIGIDKLTGQSRLAFGVPALLDGISVTTLAVGLFAMGETVHAASRFTGLQDEIEAVRGSLWMTKEDWNRSFKPWLRGIGLGFPIRRIACRRR